MQLEGSWCCRVLGSFLLSLLCVALSLAGLLPSSRMAAPCAARELCLHDSSPRFFAESPQKTQAKVTAHPGTSPSERLPEAVLQRQN